MSDIYDQHAKAFDSVAAFVILDGSGERVATVALKFPRDGAGRLYAYVHLIGVQMVRAHANGYGYDKRSAAVAAALIKIPEAKDDRDPTAKDRLAGLRGTLRYAASAMDGDEWTRVLERNGFRVLQAV